MTTTANELLQRESQTESCETRQFLAISEHSSVKGTPTAIRDWLMSFLPASHVNRSASPASEKVMQTTETSGLKPSMSFAEYDQFTHTWRTYQVSLLTLTPDEFTETWPKAGMTVDGVGYLLPKQELRIAEIDGGVLLPTVTTDSASERKGKYKQGGMPLTAAYRQWPTPNVPNGGRSVKHAEQIGNSFYHQGKKVQLGLESAVRLWPTPHGFSKDGKSNGPSGNELGRAVNQFPTPTTSSGGPEPEGKTGRKLSTVVGGSLNPTWVEWLMGWPLGWTDLKPLEMDKYQQWCEQHGICWSTTDCQGHGNE